VAFIFPPVERDVILSTKIMEVTHSTLDHSAHTTLHHKDDGWEFPILMSVREIEQESMPENPI
jgi:Cft2 family RNA processing exonuclease